MAYEPLTMLRSAALMSRQMRELAERGDLHELFLKMHERDLLLREISAVLKAGKGSAPAECMLAGKGWPELAAVLKEFEMENAGLIQALKNQRRVVAKQIAEAEGHRRLSAYAV